MTNDMDSPGSDVSTWVDAVERFVAAAPDLDDLYFPQLMALRHLAKQLDATEDPSTVMVAEYSRVHRWLLNKIGGKSVGGGSDDGPDLLDMLNQNPGAIWKP